jgi:hypothetical protein
VTLAGVNGNINPPPVSIGFLKSDVNKSRSVSADDVSAVKARSGQAMDGSNFKFDVNLSGAVNASDVSAVKTRVAVVFP